MKEFILVCTGSFVGGGARYLLTKLIQSISLISFPFGTLTVNVLGCLIIGFLSALPWSGGWMSPSAKLFLTTGLCGGFTTFSTFMNESTTLIADGRAWVALLYMLLSLLLGGLAVWCGWWIAKVV